MKKIAFLAVGVLAAQTALFAQGRGGRGGGAAGPPQAPKAAAPIDLTGYWVSVITEDWRYRMVTPARGDYQGVPMTPAARAIADTWDPAKEEASGDLCKAYGAPALLRVPGRLHITWQDDQTLRMDADAGRQTRIFHFAPPSAAGMVPSTGSGQVPPGTAPVLSTSAGKPPAGPHTIQGESIAEWVGGGRGATDGTLQVTTTNLKAGFLRKNGVPYSENATLTEYYELITQPDGSPLMVVTISTVDPMYLRQPFVITSQFKKEPSDAKWHPSDCSATW